jgi:uncharacterized protein YbjT (DUF2867 family)
MPYRAIVIGATGAVGSALVRELLGSPSCERVAVVVRRPIDRSEDKLRQIVVDMDELAHLQVEGEVAFCTMGIGQPRKVSYAEHWKVDVGYATTFARRCREAGVRHFSLLTSVGVDSRSRARYLRVKGAVEEQIRALAFPRTSFFRPSLLVTDEIRYGLQDRITQAVWPRLSWLMPKRYHEIHVDDLGRAMRINAEQDAPEGMVEVLDYGSFERLLAGGRP